jgi:hypothetical protein
MNALKKINKIFGGKTFLLVLFVGIFLTITILGVGEETPGASAIQASHYYSSNGNEGMTRNMTIADFRGIVYLIDVENGLIINILSSNSSNSSTGITQGLIGYWKLDDLSGNAIDSTSNHLDLTNNGVIQGDSVAVLGTAYHFDGDASYLSVSDSSPLNPSSAITVTAWVYKNSSDYMTILDKSGDAAQSYMLRDYNGMLQWGINRGGTGDGAIIGTDSLPVGQWTFVAATYTAPQGALNLYVNGQNVATGSYYGPIMATSVPLTIGTENQGFATWNGNIDEVGIWNRALSSSEIQQLYNSSVGETYPFD